MIYREYIPIMVIVSSLSLLLTYLTAQTSEGESFDKLDSDEPSNTDMRNTENFHNNNNVKFGSANFTYQINAKNLLDMGVVGQDHQSINKIEDLTLSHDEKITYVAMSVGGVLGVGDKLVVVPFHGLQLVDDRIMLQVTEN